MLSKPNIPGDLYHYTSVEVLALILANRTLRFSSLAIVDDPLEEKNSQVNNFGKFAYVSCWTDDSNEKIPLWKMYNNNQGVRIRVSGQKIYDSLVKDEEYITKELNKGLEENTIVLADPKYILHYKQISYCSDKKDLDTQIMRENTLSLTRMGQRKLDHWQFQKETRFLIYTIPNAWNNSKKTILEDVNDYNAGEFRVPKYIDVSFDEKEFDISEITLGPETTTAQKIIVEALIKKYELECLVNYSEYKR